MTHRRTFLGGRPAAIACAAAALASLSGCAGDDRLQAMSRQIAVLDGEVRELAKAQEANTREWVRVTADLKTLEERLAVFVGETKAVNEQVTQLETKLDAADDRMSAIQANLDEIVRKQLAPPPAPAALAPPPPPTPPASREPTAERIFNGALSSLRAGEHGQAVLEFTDFLGRFPRHPLAPFAQYWIGEAYFLQRDYRQALLELQKVLDAYPKSQAVPEALLKTGLSHRSLHDHARARAAWERLVREHPDSDAAVQARSLLAARGPSRGTR